MLRRTLPVPTSAFEQPETATLHLTNVLEISRPALAPLGQLATTTMTTARITFRLRPYSAFEAFGNNDSHCIHCR